MVTPTANEDISKLPYVPPRPEQESALNEIIEIQPAPDVYRGRFRCKRDGLIYALAIVEDLIRGRTHHARNQGFFWEGTKTEFEDQFVKV